MPTDLNNFTILRNVLLKKGVKLVVVSKTQTVPAIMEVYRSGHKSFGENRVQELVEKQKLLTDDIEWHLIGHLQTNKVKHIAPFISLIHSVDSLKLLKEINKEAAKNNRIIDCLLQIYIAKEETKYGFNFDEAKILLHSDEYLGLNAVRIIGLMGMATFTDDKKHIRKEFHEIRNFFNELKLNCFKNKPEFKELSTGMSNDYNIAIEEGSTMVRIGTLIFGKRN